jgi:hypothetical protein
VSPKVRFWNNALRRHTPTGSTSEDSDIEDNDDDTAFDIETANADEESDVDSDYSSRCRFLCESQFRPKRFWIYFHH